MPTTAANREHMAEIQSVVGDILPEVASLGSAPSYVLSSMSVFVVHQVLARLKITLRVESFEILLMNFVADLMDIIVTIELISFTVNGSQPHETKPTVDLRG